MRISHISTYAKSDSMRTTIRSLQNEILRAQTEVATGKLADYGEALGIHTRELTSAKRSIERIAATINGNALGNARLDATQQGIGQISEQVRQLNSGMMTALSQAASRDTIIATAQQSLAAIEDVLNATVNGAYIFGGINSNSKVTEGFADSAAKAALDASFFTYFGFDKNDPAAASIDQASMQDFLDNVVTPQFLGTDWLANYSNASDQGVTQRIGMRQVATTSISANEDGFRAAVMAAAIASEMFDSAIGDAALRAVSEKTITIGEQSLSDLADTQGKAGVAQDHLAKASARLESQSLLFQDRAATMENIDQYEASTRLNTLLSQLEISFSITARVQSLSLMNFLS